MRAVAGINDVKKMHAVEADIDAELVVALLADQFPQWAELSIARFPSTGTVNAIYRLGPGMYVRLPRVPSWASDYPFSWAVYRWLPGQPLATSAAGDTDVDHRQIAADLAAFITALRTIDLTGPRCRGDLPLAKRDEFIRAAIESAADAIDAIDTIDTQAVTAAWDYPDTNPGFVKTALRTVYEILTDMASPRCA